MGEASTSTEPYSSLGSRGCSNNILPVAVGARGTSSEPDLPIGSLDCDVTLEETDTAELLSNPVTILTESCDAGCQVNTRGMQLMMKSTGTQTYKSSFEVTVCDQTTQTDVHVDEEVTNSGIEWTHPLNMNSPKLCHLKRIHLLYHPKVTTFYQMIQYLIQTAQKLQNPRMMLSLLFSNKICSNV